MLRTVIVATGAQVVLKEAPDYHFKPLDAGDTREQARSRLSSQIYDAEKWPLFEVRTSAWSNKTLLHISIDTMVVDGAAVDQRLKRLAARKDFAGGDEDWRILLEFGEAIEIIGLERLFEPGDAVLTEHFGRFAGPANVVRPKLLAAAGIDHQLNIVADGVAGRFDEQFVELPADAAEGPPTHFDGFEAARKLLLELGAEQRRIVEED